MPRRRRRWPVACLGDRILDATAELLRLHAYKLVTIEDVAERTVVGKGTI